MISTRELLRFLQEANPDKEVTEQNIRSAVRWGKAPAPRMFAGRFAWTLADARALAASLRLDLSLPAEDEGSSQ